MKGNKLILICLMSVALCSIGVLFLVSDGQLPSYSKADETSHRWLLGTFLVSTSFIWALLGFKHKKRNYGLFKTKVIPTITISPFKVFWLKKDIKYKTAFLYNSMFFMGISIFGVSGDFWMNLFHNLCTGLGAITTFMIIIGSTKGLKQIFHKVYLSIAGLVWIMGILGWTFTIYFGEFLFSYRVLVWLEDQLENLEE